MALLQRILIDADEVKEIFGEASPQLYDAILPACEAGQTLLLGIQQYDLDLLIKKIEEYRHLLNELPSQQEITEKCAMIKIRRERRLINKSLALLTTLVATKVFAPAASDIYKSAKIWLLGSEKVPTTGEGKHPGLFIDAFLSSSKSCIVPGNTNQLRLKQYGIGAGKSRFVAMAEEAVSAECWKALRSVSFERVSLVDPSIALKQDANILFLGGPVTNEVTAELNEYYYEDTPDVTKLPKFKQVGLLRWGFYCGEKAYGDWDGIEKKVYRYDKRKLKNEIEVDAKVKQPLYGLYDRKGKPKRIAPETEFVNGEEFLMQEWLIVSRRPHPNFNGKRIVSIGGMHGYSLAAFAENIKQLLELLDSTIKDYDCFQLLIPASLQHNHAQSVTRAILHHNRADLYSLPNERNIWVQVPDVVHI